MGRVSSKANKNIYQTRREELGLSREKASELLKTIPPERIENDDRYFITPEKKHSTFKIYIAWIS